MSFATRLTGQATVRMTFQHPLRNYRRYVHASTGLGCVSCQLVHGRDDVTRVDSHREEGIFADGR
jgi:hypothetical protein